MSSADSPPFPGSEAWIDLFAAVPAHLPRASRRAGPARSFARLYCRAATLTAAAFSKAPLLRTVPYRARTLSTDDGVRFPDSGKPRRHPTERLFGRVSRQHGIEHPLTRPYHPWTNGQAEGMVRAEGGTVGAYRYETHRRPRRDVADYLAVNDFARLLRALGWKTSPYEAIRALRESEVFRRLPDRLTPGPNT